MKSQEFKMPIFGVGPIYVITCLILTIAGIFMIILGLYLWIQAVIVQKINKKVTEKSW